MNRRNLQDRQSSSNSGCSSKLKRVKCKCGNNAILRIVRNGTNVGSKFYGFVACKSVIFACSNLFFFSIYAYVLCLFGVRWMKDTTCNMFLPIEGIVEDLSVLVG
ncbi:hypothetical protein RDABS01_020175 [Bienertia sinuspersici]